jgi:hypothetical protein
MFAACCTEVKRLMPVKEYAVVVMMPGDYF